MLEADEAPKAHLLRLVEETHHRLRRHLVLFEPRRHRVAVRVRVADARLARPVAGGPGLDLELPEERDPLLNHGARAMLPAAPRDSNHKKGRGCSTGANPSRARRLWNILYKGICCESQADPKPRDNANERKRSKEQARAKR